MSFAVKRTLTLNMRTKLMYFDTFPRLARSGDDHYQVLLYDPCSLDLGGAVSGPASNQPSHVWSCLVWSFTLPGRATISVRTASALDLLRLHPACSGLLTLPGPNPTLPKPCQLRSAHYQTLPFSGLLFTLSNPLTHTLHGLALLLSS